MFSWSRNASPPVILHSTGGSVLVATVPTIEDASTAAGHEKVDHLFRSE